MRALRGGMGFKDRLGNFQLHIRKRRRKKRRLSTHA